MTRPTAIANRLLARLPHRLYQRLLPQLRPVPLGFKQVLCPAGRRSGYAYFPQGGVVSALTMMEDGSAIEVATVGNEGMVGPTGLLELETSPHQIIVQVEGQALRIKTAALREESGREGPLRRLLLRYHQVFVRQISQTAACNGLHDVQQRCCRWLLLSHDRIEGDALPLTHEFLAIMLGVRRATVSDVLLPLQRRGLIRSHRGETTILDRAGLEAACCECYRVIVQAYQQLLG
jgi:CRP-like cAMP-binding protein